jgi:putative endonuclease
VLHPLAKFRRAALRAHRARAGRYTGGMARWYVYVLECHDGSLYTGTATDVDRRYAAHAAGKGARYTRAHPPLRVLARFEHPDRAAACRAEHAIKQLSPARKRALCADAQAMVADSS